MKKMYVIFYDGGCTEMVTGQLDLENLYDTINKFSQYIGNGKLKIKKKDFILMCNITTYWHVVRLTEHTFVEMTPNEDLYKKEIERLSA